MQFLVRKRKRQLVGSLATPLYRYLCTLQLLYATPSAEWVALSVHNFWAHKKSPVPKNRGSVVRPKGFEPPTF